MTPYTVPLVNSISGSRGTATISGNGPAIPVVLEVEIGSGRVGAAYEDVEVVVRFDPLTLSASGGKPFGFEVTVRSDPLPNGDSRVAMDGDDRLTSFSQIEADYAIGGDSSAASWRQVNGVKVHIIVEPK